jgi:hypothetical protein
VHTYSYEIRMTDTEGKGHVTVMHISTTLNTPEIAAARDRDMQRHLEHMAERFRLSVDSVHRLDNVGIELGPTLGRVEVPLDGRPSFFGALG